MGWGWTDYLPGLSNTHALFQGHWGDAINPVGFLENDYNAGKNAVNYVRHAEEAPFDEKRQAYDQVSQMAGDIKQQRIARQQDTLQRTLAARDPERKAIHALYGDPSTWTL